MLQFPLLLVQCQAGNGFWKLDVTSILSTPTTKVKPQNYLRSFTTPGVTADHHHVMLAQR
eukprot:1157455-Pelagomonas_calceolata.AAC.4